MYRSHSSPKLSPTASHCHTLQSFTLFSASTGGSTPTPTPEMISEPPPHESAHGDLIDLLLNSMKKIPLNLIIICSSIVLVVALLVALFIGCCVFCRKRCGAHSKGALLFRLLLLLSGSTIALAERASGFDQYFFATSS